MSPEEIESSLGYQIHITANILRNNFNDFLKPFDIYTEQYGVLCMLHDEEERTLSNIAEFLVKEKTTVTRLIDSLVKKGYIQKRQSKSDRRASKVSITTKGLEIYDEIGTCLKVAKKSMEEQIDLKEREITLRVLAQLRGMNVSEEVQKVKKEKLC